jgi:phosphomannomutase
MHGVGYKYIVSAFEAVGFARVVPVVEQCDPDPEFPTVKYPNPEEGKGALALAMATADRAGSNIILANDPDADRLAVAVRTADGAWRILSGNEIGALFGKWTWDAYSASGALPSNACMLSSAVSSMILKSMAAKEGFKFEDTLTGFKWMGTRARELQAEGCQVSGCEPPCCASLCVRACACACSSWLHLNACPCTDSTQHNTHSTVPPPPPSFERKGTAVV